MDLHVTLEGRRDLPAQIYRQVSAAVLDGRLRAGDRLPPSRELARRLAVSRNTVAVAYDRLVAEGYAESRVGSGTYVRATGGPLRRTASPSALRPRAVWDSIEPWPGEAAPAGVRHDFRLGVPDARLFPYEAWRRIVAGELRRSAGPGYGNPAGHRGLREALARHLGVSRGVRAGAGDLIVTTSAQQALDLVCRVMVAPGDLVAVEDPGYPPARLLLESHGASVARVPVDAEGLRVDLLPEGARLVYVTPSHQFPLGMPMSRARRTALLDWAARNGAVVVEDDYDSEFRYGGRPLDPLQSIDRTGHVVYVGSFSKVMLPALRVGLLLAPEPLRAALTRAKYVTDWNTAPHTQAALARFIDDGLLARHIRRARAEYETRHEVLTRVLRRDFTGLLDVVPSATGLHVTALARHDPAPIVARVPGLALPTLAQAAQDPAAPSGLVFGYGAIAPTGIEPALRLLRAAWPA
ncbi:PLP-dependent aminotransferase family protein [Bailinhaonella thermotolerans]|uniref:PLP-dependent aminotransferase family protein n=1 Tax=Bailinhaonella thermotolerans TaxID=1070861 RepID=A0A3A4B5K6_9ACTN|nr:PLP-dependent aminotransferase family protein [Bailinhaonella thermotolerans]RJL35910.1 PLP-dependent aminotransferase family protein [Bailinhaonella thermotolerans]